ncbi:MAG: 50S ribosomal protein L34e [Candidatus Lokiarchaeota archaeon]|nr:50S ribosomal protein L34e [Candidatus Lokiarchaeota archaeon]
MPEPRYRSRSKNRKQIKTPGGINKLHYEVKNPSGAKCAKCKKKIHGTPIKNNVQMKNTSKVKKRTTRMYGGYLCPSCLKEALKESIRTNE